MWLAQGDALREWHKNRAKPDVGIVLNTGAGKTLVGLLMAQSLVNEQREKVLYACSSIQLVEQTTEKARGYGLDVTTYFRHEFSNDLFTRGEAPCITTYQALFNGKSKFLNEHLAAVIFDDAHAAEHLLRDHFSLRIARKEFSDVYAAVHALFKRYHDKTGKAGSYAELEDPRCHHLFLIPPFELHSQLGEMTRILHEARLQQEKSTMFAWEHVRDHVDTCCIMISGDDITITPPFVPVRSLPYFNTGVRRVYLSATLSAPDAFARTFGCIPEEVIAPTTTAGECERLIVIPSRANLERDDIEMAKELIDRRKALVLVPTYSRATRWEDVVQPPPRKDVSRYVREFRDAPAADSVKLLLAARYDGVDLPGDTCRVMVIDDLPMGVGPLERYLWERLRLSAILRTAIASRVVQSFGRISRGMSDHGVVILTGERLVEWVLIPKNRGVLPVFLQKQISLGDAVSEQADSIQDLLSAAEQCLTRDDGWIAAYNDYLADAELENADVDTEHLTRLAKSEAKYGHLMWHREYKKAAKVLRATLDDAFALSDSTGAWHCLWLGAAYQMMGDGGSAQEMFLDAHATQRNIPAYPRENAQVSQAAVPAQIIAIDEQLNILADGSIVLPKGLDTDLAYLGGSGSPAQTEKSLRALGQYLGLNATRPDNEHGTGPDALWVADGQPVLCLEVKTGKDASSRYQKKEVGQLSDHVQWVKDHIGDTTIIPVFVGPVMPATDTSNPPSDFLVVGLEQFKQLGDRLKAALTDAVENALPTTLRDTLMTTFSKRDLIWPDCMNSMEKYTLRDLSVVRN